MSDPKPAAEAEATRPSTPASPVVAFLTNVKTIIGLIVAIIAAVAASAENACKLPLVSKWCATDAQADEPPQAEALDAPDVSPDWETDIQQRVVALNAPRDPNLESINLVVWHQPSRDTELVKNVVVGLRAAGFRVREVRSALGGAMVDDRTPGVVWLKSVASRKEILPIARAAILRALKSTPYDHVRISDYLPPHDNEEVVKQGGEIRVLVF